MENFDKDIDDIIDNLDFKPITKGLGFHHSLQEVRDVKINLKKRSQSLQNEIETRVEQLDRKNVKTVNMGELAPFYNQVAPTELTIEEEISQIKDKGSNLDEASMFTRSCAWAIDFSILLSSMLAIFSMIIYFSDLPMEILNVFMISDDIFLSFSAISLLLYVFYFSFFEATEFSTPGKNILSLQVKSVGHRVTLVQSFFRSVLAISSVFLLGLPVFLRMHDRVTDTLVIKK